VTKGHCECARHGGAIEGESPLRTLLEGTVSRRQLHEAERVRETSVVYSARTCGMEARGKPQHRTKVKPRKAGPAWVSVLASATPGIQLWRDGIGDGGGGTLLFLTLGDLFGSAPSGRPQGGNDAWPMPEEKSDRPIGAWKPGNAGGAKGAMG